MGYCARDIELVITTRLSRHNSAEDKLHDELADQLAEEIKYALRKIVENKKYEPIQAYIVSYE